MESQSADRRKWVNLSYVSVSVLISYILFSLLTKLAGVYDLEARVQNVDLVIRGLSAGVGLVLFFVLFRHSRVNVFMDEVVLELSRVTWPLQKETTRATIVVLVMVLISGVALGGMDTLWTWLLQWVI